MTASAPQTAARIAERLRDRKLLVTGATGLLAKVFVEKLLRSIPDVGRIYLLVRARGDGRSCEQRLRREVLGSSVFDRLRAKLGSRFDALWNEKIRVVSGDLSLERLGLSDSDHDMLVREVDIVVNSAATVTFDERLDVALALNVEGPTRLLALARASGRATYMQVSTCYVCGRRSGDVPEELAGPPDGRPLDVDAVLAEMRQACDSIHAEANQSGESQRRGLVSAGMNLAHRHGWNDTYTFTKWLAEQRVDRLRGEVPVVILRPAIIESSIEEPMPGWIDGLRMADPMIIALGRGKLVDFPADAKAPIDIIPVDLVANAMIAALQTPGATAGLRVYHVGSSARAAMKCGEMTSYLEEGFRRRPMVDTNGRQIKVARFRLVSREEFNRKWRRRLARALRYQRKLARSQGSRIRRRRVGSAVAQMEQLLYFARIYSPYTHLNCRFLDDRLRELAGSLHPDDQKEFPVAVDPGGWRDYIANRHISGLRRFVLGGAKAHEPPPQCPADAMPDDRAIRLATRSADTIFEAFERVARRAGEKTALQISRGGKWVGYSYEESLAASACIGQRLAELGLVRGDRVVICGENCPEWGLTYLAAMRSGLTAVPLDPQLPAEEIRSSAAFTDAKLICAGRTTLDAISAVFSTGDSTCAGDAPTVVLMGDGLVPPPGAARDVMTPPARVEADDVASILFTSGTTVDPKAVPLTHANFLANARAIAEVQPHGVRDSFISVLPLYHAFAFTTSFLVPLIAGATISYVEQLKGPAIVETMKATKTTVMLVVPRLLKLFYEAIHQKVQDAGVLGRGLFRAFDAVSKVGGRRLGRIFFAKVHRHFGGHLRLIVCGGSALDPELHAAFGRLGFVVVEGYGLTETGPVLTANGPGGGKPGSAGRALSGVELEVRDAKGQGVGELWARGPNVMQGYLNNPKATAEVMREGWFRTGDLCRFDSAGYLYILGRVSETIVTDSGKNVYPDEVELRYRDLPYVRELCALGVPNPRGTGESVHAVIVPDFQCAPELDSSMIERTIREEIAMIGENIPSHQRIQTLHFRREELPKTSTLKPKRRDIRAWILAERGPSASPSSRSTAGARAAEEPTPQELADGPRFILRLLARVTSHPETDIRPESNLLLDLGVDSLMKLSIVAELEEHFDFKCREEIAAGLSRVKDLFAVVGDRPLARRAAAREKSWMSWLHKTSAAAESQSPDRRMRTNGSTPVGLWPVRWAARGGLSLFFRSYVRVESVGIHHLPASGPFILAANHTSHLDSGAVLTAIGGRRHVSITAAKDYFFDTRLKSWVFERLFDVIPFDRHSDGIQGLRRCIDLLREGDGVLFMPEGTRSRDGRMQAFKIGVAVMAIEADAPIVPTRIDHAFELMPKGNIIVRPGVVRVTFGEPVSLDAWKCPDDMNEQHQLYRDLTRFVQARVQALGEAGRDPAKKAKS